MNDIAIKVENLSKRYRIGQVEERADTLVGATMAWLKSPIDNFKRLRKLSSFSEEAASPDIIWALKDLSFEVRQGEVIGIIGRNGAGKSTLLKILSHITEPTSGRALLRGRVSSLLEVGTGFHPELTGRENIYLNGTILGMSKSEVDRKFDEIVDFSGVEEFIDTPVKRFSSGMKVRLAFSVAAHLEPEILLVDEVLAVGDAEFQSKCIGKMKDVTHEGRTVIFISHNMQAVQSLCERVLCLKNGNIIDEGDARAVVMRYLSHVERANSHYEWPVESAPGDESFKLLAIRVLADNETPARIFSSGSDICVELKFEVKKINDGLCVGFDLLTQQEQVVARSYQTDLPPDKWPKVEVGLNIWRCRIPRGLLNAGLYHVHPKIGIHNIQWIVRDTPGVEFEVFLDHGRSPFWNSLQGNSRPGFIAPIFQWNVKSSSKWTMQV